MKNKLMSNTSSNNTRIAKNTILLFPVCYLLWLYLCVQAVLEKCLSFPFITILTLQKLLCVFIPLTLSVSMIEQSNETEMVVMKAGNDTF